MLLSIYVGCAAHTLHLLSKDLFNPIASSPLAALAQFVLGLQDVVTCFTRSHLLNAQLAELQKQHHVRALVKQCPTRWCTMKHCCQSLLDSENILLTLVSTREFNLGKAAGQRQMRTKIKKIITGIFIFFFLVIIC